MKKIREDDEKPGCLLGGPLQLAVVALLLVIARRRVGPP